jgi:hypothetical protein
VITKSAMVILIGVSPVPGARAELAGEAAVVAVDPAGWLGKSGVSGAPSLDGGPELTEQAAASMQTRNSESTWFPVCRAGGRRWAKVSSIMMASAESLGAMDGGQLGQIAFPNRDVAG